MGGLALWENGALTNVDGLSGLTTVGGNLEVDSNLALTTLVLPALVTVDGDFSVRGNVTLPACEADNLLAQLTGFTGVDTITGNDDAGTCE